MRTYAETVDLLYNQLPMFHRVGAFAYKDNLDNTHALDKMYNHPHRKYKTIHVAGTNGKGSVANFIASVLQEAGYRTGLYTSPHLRDFRERIRVNGTMIPKEEVVAFVDHFYASEESKELEPSFFEFTTLMAFDFFARQNVEIAVVEVGLGGRLDSTNIISPEVSVITNISYDHMNILGDTLAKIAGEKAGIIKKNIPVVIGEKQLESMPVFIKRAEEIGAPIRFADDYYKVSGGRLVGEATQLLELHCLKSNSVEQIEAGLMGRYQWKNIPTTLAVFDVLRIKGWSFSDENIRDGLKNVIKNTGLMGRWQILDRNPLTICDTGHNEAGIRFIVEQLSITPHQKLHFVIGMVADKDVRHILPLLPADAVYYFTRASIPRAMDEKELARIGRDAGLQGETYPSIPEALAAAKHNAAKDDMIFIGGSTYTVAEIV